MGSADDTFDNLDHCAGWARDKIVTQEVQLRWALEGERFWAQTATRQRQELEAMRSTLADARANAAQWEEVAREMQGESADLAMDVIRLRRVVEACVGHHTNACRFDHHGDCQEHTSVGQVNGACAVPVGRALLHLE